jgi:hypothetical protein
MIKGARVILPNLSLLKPGDVVTIVNKGSRPMVVVANDHVIARHEGNFVRGVSFAAPISLILWVVIGTIVWGVFVR